MKFPWQKRAEQPTETRTGASTFTEAIIAQLVGDAGGQSTAAAFVGATETAAGLWGRAFASAVVSPNSLASQAINPAVLEVLGRELVRNGAALFEIEVMGGKPYLFPCAYWDVYGGANPMEWTYRTTRVGPSTTETRLVSAERVVHVRYGVSPADPWVGVSPLGRASATADLVGTLERRLAQEIGAPVGYVMPLPQGQRQQLKDDLRGMKGGLALVDSVKDWTEGANRQPSGDWTQQRVGANPPAALMALRQDVSAAVLDACGVPASLAGVGSDGTAQREAYRRFAHGTIAPVLKVAALEFADKLDLPGLEFDITGLYASDLTGRSGAFRNLVANGVEVERALAISGLLIED